MKKDVLLILGAAESIDRKKSSTGGAQFLYYIVS